MNTFKYAVVTEAGSIVSKHKTLKAAQREIKTQIARMRRVASFRTNDKTEIAEAGKTTFNKIIELT